MRAFLLALVGCSHPALLGVEAEPIRGPYGAPPQGGVVWVGTCTPDLVVQVVDDGGGAVAGARVWIRQRVSAHAIEEPMGTVEYRTIPIATDSQGRARVCGPAQVPEISPLQGIGGGWVAADGGEIVADAAGRHGTLRKPFREPLVIK